MSERIESLLSPLARTVLEEISDGVLVFDILGRLVYTNAQGRAAVEDVGEPRGDRSTIMPKLSRLGSRIVPLWIGGAKVGEAVVLPAVTEAEPDGHTLAEREREAIVATLQSTGWKLTESARRLGISRTTLWRRLRAYGLDRDNRARWYRSS